MNGLGQTFYIMAIIYMSIMFLMMIAALAAVLAIRAKINAIHDKIEEKLSIVGTAVHAGAKIAKVAKSVMGKR